MLPRHLKVEKECFPREVDKISPLHRAFSVISKENRKSCAEQVQTAARMNRTGRKSNKIQTCAHQGTAGRCSQRPKKARRWPLKGTKVAVSPNEILG